MSVLAVVKTLFARFHCIIEFCHTCGRKQPLVWHVADELWAEVMDRVDGGGVICPECFSERAMGKGMLLYWTAQSGGSQ